MLNVCCSDSIPTMHDAGGIRAAKQVWEYAVAEIVIGIPKEDDMFATPSVAPPSEILPVFPEGTVIPKVIHQVYASRNLPAVVEENIEKIKALNPEWEYRFYDDDDMAEFIKSTYGTQILGYYNRINKKYGASRADLFRYLLMYKQGGVYLDIKGSIEKPLNRTLRADDVFLLSQWKNGKGEQFDGWGKHDQLKHIGGNEFQQWHIIAAAGHPFLRAVLERVLNNIDRYNPVLHDTGKNGVLWVTGPIAYTLAITPLLNRYRHRLVASHHELGLIYSIFGSTMTRPHKSIFKFHYTELKEPVTELAGGKRILWLFFGPIQNHIIQRIRNLADALVRRFPGRRELRR